MGQIYRMLAAMGHAPTGVSTAVISPGVIDRGKEQ